MNLKITTTLGLSLLIGGAGQAASIADFQSPVLPLDSAYYGADGAGEFPSGGAQFSNNYNPTFGSWDGFAVSSKTDADAKGWAAQFNSITGDGAGGSSQYGVGYISAFAATPPTITLPAGASPVSVDLTNVSYTYYSMAEGDDFAKKFGGASGNDPDYLRLTITGLNAANQSVGAVNFYLADFTPAENALDSIVDEWTTVDLTGLDGARSLIFSIASTDVGDWGINTPTYFAIDDLVTVPEPSAALAMIGLGGAAMCCRRRRGERSVGR